MSYTSIWSYLLKLTTDAQYTEQVKDGHWIWVYDNLNLHQAIRHEREGIASIIMKCMQLQLLNYTDTHSSMLNVTARLAVRIANLPDWEVNWDDTIPQRPRTNLTIDHFLLSVDDSTALHDSAVQYTMEFLVEEFSSLKHLQSIVPAHQCPHPIQTPKVAPMAILFKDEKYTAQTIDIIRQLMDDANLSGKSEVCKSIHK